MEDALKLIISKSPAAMGEAIRVLRAIGAGSPVVQERYNHVVEMALNDPEAEFTADERAAIAGPLMVTGGPRTRDVRVRVTLAEKARITEASEEAGQTVSDYIRQRIGLRNCTPQGGDDA